MDDQEILLANSQSDESFDGSLEELLMDHLSEFQPLDSNIEIHDTSEIEMDGRANGKDGDEDRNGGAIGEEVAFFRFMKGKDGIALSKDSFVIYDDVYNMLHAITSKKIRKDKDDVTQ
ncbi:hypothetical protein FBU30_009681 [Linnemannia zychae]|nr:hypothetical protein FBU30_009681 [Linnemannia zychae]